MKRLEINYSLGVMDTLVSLARYNFVNKIINDSELKVLDFGCGSGYGTKVLQEKFSSVTSFDIYPDGYFPDNIQVCQDLEIIKKEAFDVITCFEVIEHMGFTEQQKLMDDLHSLVSNNGTLFISTVRKIEPPPTENRKKEHIRELTFDELLKFCTEKFRNVYTFGQIDQIISTFYNDNYYHFVFICTNKK